jgi:hypothetical protein
MVHGNRSPRMHYVQDGCSCTGVFWQMKFNLCMHRPAQLLPCRLSLDKAVLIIMMKWAHGHAGDERGGC